MKSDFFFRVLSRIAFIYIERYNHVHATQQRGRPMAFNLAHRPDLDSRVEKLADRLGLTGRGRKTATIERAITLLEERAAHDRSDQAAIETSLDRYIVNGSNLRERLVPGSDDGPSLSLQQVLYDERGLPE